MTPEKAIQNEILNFLSAVGVYCWQVYNGAVYDTKRKVYRKPRSRHYIHGVADILGIINGRLLAIEVKTKTGRLSDEQRVFLRHINEQGGVGIVGRSAKEVAIELSKHFPDEEKIGSFYQ